MAKPGRIFTRYRSGPSQPRHPALRSWLFAVLCVGLVALLGWVWWRHTDLGKSARQSSVQATNVPAQKGRASPPSGRKASPVPTNRPAVAVASQQPGQTGTATAPRPTRDPLVPLKADPLRPLLTNESAIEPAATTRPVQNVFEAQLAMAREGISSGSIDGALGSQTRAALTAFQRKHGLALTGALDLETKARMLVSLPLLTTFSVTTNDLGRLLPLSPTWLGKSEQPRLDYETLLELAAERGFSHPLSIRRLNPQMDWDNVPVGTEVAIPKLEYPPAGKAALIRISLSEKILEAFDSSTNLLAHFPCSIGRLAEKRPVGELRVEVIAPNPNYTFNPAVFPESEEARQLGRKLVIPPGPNNPVGVAWIGLDRPGYGIHGTPSPEMVGRTESHGCFRLANWNAEYLIKMVAVGTPVLVEP